MSEKTTPSKKSTTPWRQGTSYKAGKYFQFDSRQILVMTAWPDPRAWRRTKTIDWKQVRKQADESLSHWDMTLPECRLVEKFLNSNFDLEPGDPPFGIDEIQCALNRHLLSQFQAQLDELEDIFLPTFFWPESISTDRKKCLLAAANTLLVQHRWLSQIPLSTRKALQDFPERRWQVLNLLARCPGANDLCLSNPALAFALANNWCFHRPAVIQPYRAARALLHRKQRVIAGWLDFPQSNAAVRVLAKIQPDGLSIRRLYFFKEAMKDPATLKLLSHLPTISACVLDLVNCRLLRTRLSYKFLLEVCNFEKERLALLPTGTNVDLDGLRWLPSLIRDVAQMLRNGRDQPHWPSQFRSIGDFKRFHDLVVTNFNSNSEQYLEIALAENKTFPPPPFPGSEDIQPISTPQELVSEGVQMQHCIGSYLNRARVRGFYAYRVTSPVRATLSIRQNSKLEWVADESVTYDNQRITGHDRTNLFQTLFASNVTQSAKTPT